MEYYKITSGGYIIAVGRGKTGEEITKDEYDEIFTAIHTKPPATETTDYRLREDLTWEVYPIDPPDPDPEIEDAELLDILMGVTE